MSIKKGTKVKAWSEDREPTVCYYLEEVVIDDFEERYVYIVSLTSEPCFGEVDCFNHVEVLGGL